MVVKIYPYNHRITISNLSSAGQVTDPAPPKCALPGTGPADHFRKLEGLFVGAKRHFNGRRVNLDGKLQVFFLSPPKNGGTVFHLFSWWQSPPWRDWFCYVAPKKHGIFSSGKFRGDFMTKAGLAGPQDMDFYVSFNESFQKKTFMNFQVQNHFWRPYQPLMSRHILGSKNHGISRWFWDTLPSQPWRATKNPQIHLCNAVIFPCSLRSMGREYLPIHGWLIFMVNVVKYTIHGSFGMEISIHLFFS